MDQRHEPSLLLWIAAFFGRLGSWLLPVGLFAVVAIGIHSGSDSVDDRAFLLLNRLDALLDQAMGAWIRGVGNVLGASKSSLDHWVLGAISFVDLERKERLARVTALAVELIADLLVAYPVFIVHREHHSAAMLARRLFRDPTLLRIVAPVAALLACLAGSASIARELQVLAHAGFDRPPHAVAGRISSAFGIAALAVVGARLALPVVLAGARWADLRAEQDAIANRSPLSRRMRGWMTLVVALPVTLLAAFEATPVLGTLRALLPW